MATFVKSSDDGVNAFGNWRSVVGRYTGPASYVVGGDPVTPSTFGLSDIRFLFLGITGDDINGPANLELNAAKTKIIWWVPNGGSEYAGGANLSDKTVWVLAVGR